MTSLGVSILPESFRIFCATSAHPAHTQFSLTGDKDAAVLAKVSKQDIIDFFMRYVHPSSSTRRKLSIHLTSSYKGAKLDQNKAQALVMAFKMKNVTTSDSEMMALMGSSPSLQDIQAYGKKCLAATKDLSEMDRAALEKQVQDLGESAGESEDVKVRSSNVVVKDIVRWKAELIPSKAATPLMDFEVERSM